MTLRERTMEEIKQPTVAETAEMPTETAGENVAKEQTKEPTVWYAVRTFNHQECAISDFLKEKDVPHFIPMIYKEKGKANEKPKRVLVPVVHNLLFIRKSLPEREMMRLLQQCVIPMSVLKKEDRSAYYEIPDSQMLEFRAMCDPEYRDTRYVTKEDADAKPGKMVRIIQGPFKGQTGKLVRLGNDYFIVKTMVSIGVMLHISRWYCEVVKS